MEKGDKKRFRDVVQMLGMNYRTQITTPLLQLYWQGLEDLPLAKVEDAVNRAIKECEYMPVVAKLRELSKRSPQKALQPISDFEIEKQKKLVAESWAGKRDEVRKMLAALPDSEFAKAVRGMATK